MKFLFSTVTFFISHFNIKESFEQIDYPCNIYAAGRLGLKIAGKFANGISWSMKCGYKYGSISIKEKGISLLIFNSGKAKISIGFNQIIKSEEEMKTFIHSKIKFYCDIIHKRYERVVIQNITVQKTNTNLPKMSLNQLMDYTKKCEHLFHKVIYPDRLIHTRPGIRCYLNDISNAHVVFDTTGGLQILGGRSYDDVITLYHKFQELVTEIIFEELLF